MTNRSNRAKLAQTTLEILDQGSYQINHKTVSIQNELEHCIDNTKLYKAEEEILLSRPDYPIKTLIEIQEGTTLEACQKAITDFPKLKTLALNFASAYNPGGSFLSGTQAQEESLARSSGLYSSIVSATDYYEENRVYPNSLYLDHMIYSTNVPVFRNDDGTLLESPYSVSMITAPAVNAGAVYKNTPHLVDQLQPVMQNRIQRLFDIALKERYQHLILGAWGCGVFRNDPHKIAQYFHHHLVEGDYKNVFERITFGILDNTKDQSILKAFEVYFG